MPSTRPLLGVAVLLTLSWLAAVGGLRAAARPMRPLELLDRAGIYVGREIDLEVVEPLGQATTPEALAASTYGSVEIQIPEAPGAQLKLVPAAWNPGDPKRFEHKFDRVLPSPLRVHGVLFSDDEMAKDMRRPYWVIRVVRVEPLDLGTPERVPSLAAITADPTRWDRRLVTYEGDYRYAFEVMALDGKIWLEGGPGVTVVGKPVTRNKPLGTDHVRATGVLYAHPGARYGHLGGYPFELVASKLEYLGPTKP